MLAITPNAASIRLHRAKQRLAERLAAGKVEGSPDTSRAEATSGAHLWRQRSGDAGAGGAVRAVVRLLIEWRTASTHPTATHTAKMNHCTA